MFQRCQRAGEGGSPVRCGNAELTLELRPEKLAWPAPVGVAGFPPLQGTHLLECRKQVVMIARKRLHPIYG